MTLAMTSPTISVGWPPMNDRPPRPIPERVRERRVSLQLSHQKLADRLSLLIDEDVKWQSVQQFERGKNQNPRFLWQFARALTTSDEYLAGLTDDPVPNPTFTTVRPNDVSARVGRKHSGTEGHVRDELFRLIGRLEARIDALEARLTDREPEGPATTKGPRRGTRGR